MFVRKTDDGIVAVSRIAKVQGASDNPRTKHSVKRPKTGHGEFADESTLKNLIDQAIDVLGSRDEAYRWLGTPIRALNFATPISLIGTADGLTRVTDLLGQIEHGVW